LCLRAPLCNIVGKLGRLIYPISLCGFDMCVTNIIRYL